MIKLSKQFSLLLLLVLFFQMEPALAREVPIMSGRVNDYADILSPEWKKKLRAQLEEFETQTSNQVVVLTVVSLEGDDLESFAFNAFNEWVLGQKGKNNGVLLLIVSGERKIRIEVGYGLEASLTDALAGRIIRNELAPHFREQEFGPGIEAAVTAIIQATKGEYRPTPDPKTFDEIVGGDMSYLPLLVIIGLFVILILPFYLVYLNEKYWKRNKKQYDKSGVEMQRLDEVQDDAHLNERQRLEEKLGSVDYDVWVSEDQSEVKVLRYRNSSSYFSKCPECFAYTRFLLKSNTHSNSDGSKTVNRYFRCKNCDYEGKTKAKVPAPSARRSAGSISFGGSGGFSSGSFSSSSSSSFSGGGGSSGGGGASGGW